MSKSNTLLSVSKRGWLLEAPSLTAGSYYLYLSELKRHTKVDGKWTATDGLHFTGKLTFYFRDHPIVIHACDLTTVKDRIEDFIRKLSEMTGLIQQALDKLADWKPGKERPRFAVKGFLNPDEGAVSIYTSTLAITSSSSHGLTFELSSCDHKTRITLHGKEGIQFLTKLIRFLSEPLKLLEESLSKHQELIFLDHEGTKSTYERQH